MFLSVNPGIQFRPEAFGGLVFIPSRSMTVELNRIGYSILEDVAVGYKSEEEILTQFPKNKQEEVRRFIQTMLLSSIVEYGESPEEERRIIRNASLKNDKIGEERSKGYGFARHLSAPIFAWWDITKICNLRCKQCYSNSGKIGKNELTTSEAFSIIEQLAENMVFYIYFLGGEPLLRRDFFEILNRCKERNITTMMSTNGWFVDKEIAKKLLDSGIQIVRVSIDGATADVHDKIRGVNGSFERALEAISILKGAGIPNVGVSPTLLVDNYFQIGDIIDIAFEYGADEVQVVQLCSTGRAERINDVSIDQFREARQLVQKALYSYPDRHVTATEGILRKQCENCVSVGSAIPSFIGCTGGRTCMAISENGVVFPCILYRKSAGNLRKDVLADIWRDSVLFNDMRKIKEECVGCSYVDRCAGECPLAKEKPTEQERAGFIRKATGGFVNREECSKFVGENLCFIRF